MVFHAGEIYDVNTEVTYLCLFWHPEQIGLDFTIYMCISVSVFGSISCVDKGLKHTEKVGCWTNNSDRLVLQQQKMKEQRTFNLILVKCKTCKK